MAMEILPTREKIKRLKKEFEAHPEKFPQVPGKTYRIVVCESDGTPIRNPKSGRSVSPVNPVLKIMHLENGLEKEFITFPLT